MKKKTLPNQHASPARYGPDNGVLKNAVFFLAGGGVAHLFARAVRFALLLLTFSVLQMIPGDLQGQNLCDNLNCAPTSGNYNCVEAPFGFASIGEVTGPNNNQLLPPGQAATSPQNVFISGTISFDQSYTFAPESNIVFLTKESGFLISNGATLTIGSNSIIKGCNVLWLGCTVYPNSKLIINSGCRIEDARVFANVENNATFSTTGSVYRRNWKAMVTSAPKPNVSIVGNEFHGEDALPQPTGTTWNPGPGALLFYYPILGVEAHFVQQLNIGISGGATNLFTGYSNTPNQFLVAPIGIYAESTNLTVRGTRFTNMGKALPPGEEVTALGISCPNTDFVPRTLDFVGLGRDGASTFSNVHTGVYCRNMTVLVSSTRFTSGKTQMLMEAPLFGSSLPARYVLNNNRFEHYLCFGVKASNLFPVYQFNVTNNYFVDNNLGSYTSFLPRSGLLVNNRTILLGGDPNDPAPGYAAIAKQGSLYAFNNYFINSDKNPDAATPYPHEGATIQGVYNATLVQNFFTNELTNGLGSGSYLGANLYAAPQYALLDNYFNGTALSYASPSDDPTGALIQYSGYGTNQCNHFDQLMTGMRFDGNSCDGSFLFQNNFGRHKTGLFLNDPVTIGEQDGTMNTWEIATASPNREAVYTAPNDQNFTMKMEASKFRIYEPEAANSLFWATPRVPGGAAWFSPGITEPPTYSVICPIDHSPPDARKNLTYTDQRVLDGTMPELDGYPATKWDAQMRLYAKLVTYPDLRPSGSAAAVFYTAQQTSSFARFATISEQMRTVTSLSPALYQTLGGYYDQLRAVGLQLILTDSLISVASVGALAGLLTTRDNLLNEQATVEQSLASVLGTYRTGRTAGLLTLQTDLNSIVASTQYEVNMKTALRVMIEGALATNTEGWTAQQEADLKEVANQCSLPGGHGVIFARAMLFEQRFSDEGCLSEPRSSEGRSAPQGIEVYPNPTTGLAHLRLRQAMSEAGAVVVQDPMGRQVLRQNIGASSSADLNLNGLVPGLYFVHLLDGTRTVSVSKVFLNQ